MNVIDFIYNQKGAKHNLLLQLHAFISEYDCIQSSLKWGIPFWTIGRTICYANPLKTGGVELVFWNGTLLIKDFPILNLKDRKRMAGIIYEDAEDIDFELLNAILLKAIAYDEQLGKK